MSSKQKTCRFGASKSLLTPPRCVLVAQWSAPVLPSGIQPKWRCGARRMLGLASQEISLKKVTYLSQRLYNTGGWWFESTPGHFSPFYLWFCVFACGFCFSWHWADWSMTNFPPQSCRRKSLCCRLFVRGWSRAVTVPCALSIRGQIRIPSTRRLF